jgi:hypothetical protein
VSYAQGGFIKERKKEKEKRGKQDVWINMAEWKAVTKHQLSITI